jgi:hypothetical protein
MSKSNRNTRATARSSSELQSANTHDESMPFPEADLSAYVLTPEGLQAEHDELVALVSLRRGYGRPIPLAGYARLHQVLRDLGRKPHALKPLARTSPRRTDARRPTRKSA